MAIPSSKQIKLALLQLAADKKQHSNKEAYDHIASRFSMSKNDREEPIPSGHEPRLNNRIRWVLLDLRRKSLLESITVFEITDSGLEELKQQRQGDES